MYIFFYLIVTFIHKEDFGFSDYFVSHYLVIIFILHLFFFLVDYLGVSADNDYLISPFQWLYLLLPNSFSNLLHKEEVLERIENILVLFLALSEIRSAIVSKEHSTGF